MRSRILIAGSRTLDAADVAAALRDMLPFSHPSYLRAVELVTGCATRGADQAPFLLQEHYPTLKVTRFPADWNKYGRRAGFIRNAAMADYADILWAFWDGESHGTKNMISEMQQRGKLVLVTEWEPDDAP